MDTSNRLAAKVIGDIIAEGMSISGFDIGECAKNEAVGALDEIRLIMYNSDEKNKLAAIENVIKRYGIKPE